MKISVLSAFLIVCPLWISSAVAASSIEPGTVVVYSNGLVERLMSRDDDLSVWETDRKRVYERAHTGFFENRREERYPEGSRSTVWEVDEAGFSRLASMGPGSTLNFIATRIRDNFEVSNRVWTCSYEADLLEQVAGTEVNAQHFKCTRYSRYRVPSRIREQRELKYAPDLGVVIWERHERMDAKAREREVVAILSPEKATLDAISDIVKAIN